MKKLIAISAMALVMTTCSVPSTGAEVRTSAVVSPSPYTIGLKWFEEEIQKRTLLEEQAAHQQQLEDNTEEVRAAIEITKRYIGITPWVFSGSTPRAWDCSGMVLWTYKKLGVELRHSATSQMKSGTIVDTPKYGDLVGFRYKGYNSAYHVGIYISPDLMLHSGGKPGDRTELRSISNFAGNYSEVFYSRIIETK